MIKASERLYEERIKKGLTLQEVAKATKIKEIFLSHIEKGEYSKLPSRAYVQGFVRNYAQFLGLSQKEILALFRREFNEKEFIRVLPEGFAAREEVTLRGIRFGSTAMGIFLIIAALVLYLLFQYRYAFLNPPLEIVRPKEGEKVTQTVNLIGKTDPNAVVFVNQYPVSVDANGNFTKTFSLFPGKSTIQVKSQNRFGKQTEIQRHVEVVD